MKPLLVVTEEHLTGCPEGVSPWYMASGLLRGDYGMRGRDEVLRKLSAGEIDLAVVSTRHAAFAVATGTDPDDDILPQRGLHNLPALIAEGGAA